MADKSHYPADYKSLKPKDQALVDKHIATLELLHAFNQYPVTSREECIAHAASPTGIAILKQRQLLDISMDKDANKKPSLPKISKATLLGPRAADAWAVLHQLTFIDEIADELYIAHEPTLHAQDERMAVHRGHKILLDRHKAALKDINHPDVATDQATMKMTDMLTERGGMWVLEQRDKIQKAERRNIAIPLMPKNPDEDQYADWFARAAMVGDAKNRKDVNMLKLYVEIESDSARFALRQLRDIDMAKERKPTHAEQWVQPGSKPGTAQR